MSYKVLLLVTDALSELVVTKRIILGLGDDL